MARIWFGARASHALAPDEVLTHDGIPLAGADEHRGAWLHLSRKTCHFTTSMSRIRQ